MKNSKRLVTLLLALVMLIGVFTIGAGATELPDELAAETPVSQAITVKFSSTFGSLTLNPGQSYTHRTEGYTLSVGGATYNTGDVLTYEALVAYADASNTVYVTVTAVPTSVPSTPLFPATPSQPGNKPGHNPGNKPGNKPGQNPGNKPGHNPGQNPGNKPGHNPGNKPGCGYPGCNKPNCNHHNVPNGRYKLNVEVYFVDGSYGLACNHNYPCNKCTPYVNSNAIFNSSWAPGKGPYQCNHSIRCTTNCSNSYYGGYHAGFNVYGDGYYNAGQTVSVRATAPARSSYKFYGWYTSYNGRFSTSMNARFKMPAANTTVYAVFQVMDGCYNNCNQYHSHTIRYTDGVTNEVVFNDVVRTVRHGYNTPTIADPVRPGYRFAGWSPKVTKTATECVTYVAQWTVGNNAACGNVQFTSDHVAYLKGFGKGEFRPDQKMTRAEFAVLLYRLLDEVTVRSFYNTNSPFVDVAADAWYNEAVSTLANAGVIGGGATYRPNEYITRAEMVSMLANFYYCDEVYACNYKDVPNTYWAYEAIALAQYMGWVKGYGGSTFLPEATISRAEVAAIMNRVLGRTGCGTVDTKHYVDVPTNAWFYQDVVEATIVH